MTALIQNNEELLSIDSELSYSDEEEKKPDDTEPARMVEPKAFVEETKNESEKQEVVEKLARPSSKIRVFNTMGNLKMSSNNLNQVLPIEYPKDFEILWNDLSYSVRLFQRERFRVSTRMVLKNLCGTIKSGQVTAIMGPSGAGKSTLLEIIAGKGSRSIGLTGSLKIKDINNIRIALVPQNNYLMEKLTVFETLLYACKLNYSTQPNINFENKVDKLISRFGLEKIRDNFVARCSGGQQKRVSIALELFSKPNLLILDEPTTGLDSSSCTLVVKLLKELISDPQFPMAIVATIHQPSWNVFTEFDHVFILTRNGENLYSGPPNKLLPTLAKCNLPCDKYNSPSDYIIEIAAEDYGTKPIELLQSQIDRTPYNMEGFDDLAPLLGNRVIRQTPFLKSMSILMSRAWLIYKRNLFIAITRIVSIILITVWLSVMFGREIGKVSGCPMRKLELYSIPIEKLSTLFEEGILSVTQNSCALFFGLMVGLISGMTSVVLEFPREMHIFMKEYNNGWYSCISFYITKTLIDIPLQVIIPSIYVVYIYYYTNQPTQYFREFYLLTITILVSFVSESIGASCSAIFMRQPTTAAFVAGAIPMPMILFGGFLVKYSRMPGYMRAVSWLSLMKYAFEGLMVTIYGFERCAYSYNEFLKSTNVSAIEKPIWARVLPLVLDTLSDGKQNIATNNSEMAKLDEDEKAIYMLYTTTLQALNGNETTTTTVGFDRSLILSYYEIESDNVLYYSLIAMVLYFIVFKVMTYYVILGKLRYG